MMPIISCTNFDLPELLGFLINLQSPNRDIGSVDGSTQRTSLSLSYTPGVQSTKQALGGCIR